MTEHTDNATYEIGTVSRLTGLSVHTIRIWERRYAAVVASRSASGRRRYTVADVERLGLLKRLTDLGEPIGRIADLSDEVLRQRLDELRKQRADLEELKPQARMAIAILGESAAALARKIRATEADVEIVTAVSNAAAWRADIRRTAPDALLLEFSTLSPADVVEINDLRQLARGARCAVLYRFARRDDLQRLAAEGVSLLHSPAEGAEIIRGLSAGRPMPGTMPVTKPPSGPREFDTADLQIPPRRYAYEQLTRLASLSTSIDCECPRHLVDLIQSLSAFEAYSANCEDRNPDDAALHAYLHAQTAKSRAIMEQALAQLARVEGFDPGS